MRRDQTFTTIRTEGAALPSDLLQRIAGGDRDLPGLTGEDYHLERGERLNEAVNRAWNRLQSAWATFQGRLAHVKDEGPATGVTRDRWLLPLFDELGYGRLPASRAVTLDGREFPISHMYGQAPIHLVGWGVDLDRRTAGVAGAARSSPHSLVQEFLNTSDDHLWGFVANGRKLRILRDNASLTRQAYVEFDLQGMMEGEVYADFVLLWLLCHQSRVEGERPEDCWLERWYRASQEQGVRALDRLRDGVQQAIEALGRGFLAHRSNAVLRDRLRVGTLSAQDYYRQTLRLVYRLLFLFAAEDRGLLLDPNADDAAKRRYLDYYASARLRHLAERRHGSRHSDLYQGLVQVMDRLGSAEGYRPLALPALGGFLFSADALPDLAGCEIANHDLLDAVRALAYITDGQRRRAVDYKNLGADELGSVYESLLELHPQLDLEPPSFKLGVASGNERKTTGSYYTPSSLINCLLDSALDPVLDEAARRPDPQAAILDLKICDPACGSGHFLVAAAHRVARRLAAIRSGDAEPSPEATRHALREVIGRCIYGVDLNPMAVELCKVSLWLEALEPGKALSFLDHKIQVGNSLLGATPRLLAEGIPDAAFEPIEGDDKPVCSEFRKKNKAYREGNRSWLDEAGQPWMQLDAVAGQVTALDSLGDDTVEGERAKQDLYREMVESAPYRFARLRADAWCAAFVWKKRKTAQLPFPITENIYREIEKNPHHVSDWMLAEIQRLAGQYAFFHWHLAFPGVFRVLPHGESPDNAEAGWSGGFDVVLGNPPWERIKLQEKEWFAARRPDIANAANAAARRRMIAALKDEDPAVYRAFEEGRRQAEGESHLVRDTGRYSLTAVGDVNTYAVFAETNRMIVASAGRVGCIVPSGIATDDTTKFFFQELMDTASLVSIYSFENEEFLFPAVHHAMKFCLLTLSGAERPVQVADFVFYARNTDHLRDENRHFGLTAAEIALLNPNTRTALLFRSKHDAELTKAIYQWVPVLVNEQRSLESWSVKLQRVFDMNLPNVVRSARLTDDLVEKQTVAQGNSRYIDREGTVWLPVYEGKMVGSYNHRAASVELRSQNVQRAAQSIVSSEAQLMDPRFVSKPAYWMPVSKLLETAPHNCGDDWVVAYKDITATTNERTVIAAVLPHPSSNFTIRCAFLPQYSARLRVCFLAMLNSLVCDYVARQSLAGLHLSDYIVKQLPLIPPSAFSPENVAFIGERVLELTYTAWDLQPFAQDCGFDGPPFRWDEARRFLLRCELDAAYFHLYGIERDDVAYIMDTFPIVKRKDEAAHGEYRTKRAILEIYDAMADAMRTGQPYQTRLDPPPADPRVAHPAREMVGADERTRQ